MEGSFKYKYTDLIINLNCQGFDNYILNNNIGFHGYCQLSGEKDYYNNLFEL